MSEEQKIQNHYLVKVENNSLKEIGKRMAPKVADGIKRVGKIVGWGSLSFLGIGALAIGNLPVATIGGIAAIGTGARAIQNTLFKTEPSLMFMSRIRSGERQIFQDVRLNLASKMKDYTTVEKAGMMALQTLVGFSRYKNNLRGSDMEISENGEGIYSQKISTVTHGINLKTLQMIEDLGYIKIDSMEEKFRQNIVGKMLGREPKGLRNLLILEKLGFRNYNDIKKISLCVLKGDKQTLESMRKTFQKVTFRLTDKPIDFEELYKKSADLSQVTDKQERMALKRLSVIFDNKQGILATKNIDIGKDSFGRDVIKFNRPESFGKRVARNVYLENMEKSNFREELARGVEKEGLEKRALEQAEQKQEKQVEREKEVGNEIGNNV